MSTAAVATIAFLALVAGVGAAAWAVVEHRRVEGLERSLTARKWDIVTLRAELGALRQQVVGDPVGPEPVGPELSGPGGADLGGADLDGADLGGPEQEPGARTPGTPGSRPRIPAAPTAAWRRDRARTGPTRPRRRRPT